MKHILYQLLNTSTNSLFVVISLVCISFWVSSCQKNEKTRQQVSIEEVHIIPQPKKILYKRGIFKLSKSSKVLMNLSDDKSKIAGKQLIDNLFLKSKFKLKIADIFTTTSVDNAIEIITDTNEITDPEGFKIIITQNRIKIIAAGSSGLFYASEVALSLLIKTNNTWSAPQIIIEDQPKVKQRGIYLTLNDSTIIDDNLIKLLTTNRINYLITSKELPAKNYDHIQIANISNFGKDWKTKIVSGKSIKTFYQGATSRMDTLLFQINNSNQLHPDSLAVLGQAFWSSSSNSDYHQLIKQLKAK